MIETWLSNAIDHMNDRSADAVGDSVPGFQPKFHEALRTRVHSTSVPDPLSVVAPESTYFVVQNKDGSRGYTRAGAFQVRDGRVITPDGRQVLGYPEGRTQGDLVPMQVPASTPDGWVNISVDGIVSVCDPKEVLRLDEGSAGKIFNGPVAENDATLPADMGLDLQHKAHRRASSLDDTAGSAAHDAAPTGVADTHGMPLTGSGAPTVTPLTGSGAPTVTPLTGSGTPTVTPLSSTIDEHIATVRGANDITPSKSTSLNIGIGPAESFGSASKLMGLHGDTLAAEANEESAADRAADLAADRNAALNTPPLGLVAGAAGGVAAPAMGTPYGRLALARFPAGTIVDNDGVASSKVPVELGVAKSGQLGALKTNSRDLGSVDAIPAEDEIIDASHLLSAVMAAEQAEMGRVKKAMDLIK